jgi:hypothetical protein
MVGQARSDRRISRREREGRRDEFRIRRYEIERDTLLALQDAVLEHVKIASQILGLKDRDARTKQFTSLTLDEMQIRMLAGRCLNMEAAQAVITFCDQVSLHVKSAEGQGPGWGPQLARAFDLLGEALRRDPFE